MKLRLSVDVADNYSSAAQQIRVMTEYWVNRSVFCPNCNDTN